MAPHDDVFGGWEHLEQAGFEADLPGDATASSPGASFHDAQARAMRALALAHRDLAGLATARRTAAAVIAAAARVAAAAARVARDAIARASAPALALPPTLPAAAAGINLAARILPAPRAARGGG